MPFGFNFGSSSNSSTFNGTDNYTKNFNQTATPTNAPWVTNLGTTLGGMTQNLTGADPRSFVAGPNGIQTQAGSSAAGLTGTPWNYDSALGLTAGVANANAPRTAYVDSTKMIPSFMDPYLNDVVSATSADLDQSDNMARQQFALQDPSAFGGSGISLTLPALDKSLSIARGETLGGLRSQGFQSAVSAAQAEAGRKQAANDTNASLMADQANRTLGAAQQLGTLAGQEQDTQRQNIASQAGIGGVLQQIQQLKAQSPLDYQNFLTSLFNGLWQPFHGETDTGTEKGTETQQGTQQGKGSNFGFGFKAGS